MISSTAKAKIAQLTPLAVALHRAHPDWFVGGCGEVTTLILRIATEAGISGIVLEAGVAQRHRKYRPVIHAWLRIDGVLFDPTWLGVFKRSGVAYEHDARICVIPEDDPDWIESFVTPWIQRLQYVSTRIKSK